MRVALLTSLLLLQGAIAMPDPLNVGSARQLFIDQRFIAASDHVTLTQNSPHRLGPVILPDKPWEAQEIGFCASVMEHDGGYWFFYRATAKDGSAGVCLATSTDGVHWDKPDLGLVEFEGSKHNNIVFWGVGEAVVFYDPHGSDDARFKCIVALHWPDPKLAGLYVYTSPDGLHWTPGAERVTTFLPDTANQAMWDTRLGKYVAYIRVWHPIEHPLRRVGRVEMDDILAPWPYDKPVEPFHIWGADKVPVSSSEVPTVFGLDDQDPPNCDVYNAAAVEYPWAADAYFLFPSAYQHFPDPPVGKWGNDGLLDIIMAVSLDGVHWSRVVRGPYLSLTPAGKESKSLYMAVGMVRRGDEILQYFAGYETTHGDPGPHPHPIGSLCAAVQRMDGFVSADFAYGGGSLTTPLLVFDGARLELNLDCSAMGRTQVELQDGDGKPLPGFTMAEADVIYGNSVGAVVTWKGKSDVSALSGKPVRLHITARSAKLYAFQFVP